MHRSLLLAVLSLALAGAVAVIPACSGQGEGERCDVNGDNGGTDECASGLVCTKKGTLPSRPDTDICCPANLTQAAPGTVCSLLTGLGEAGIPDSGGTTTDSSVTDATGDTASPDAATNDAPSSDAADTGSNAADAADGGG